METNAWHLGPESVSFEGKDGNKRSLVKPTTEVTKTASSGPLWAFMEFHD